MHSEGELQQNWVLRTSAFHTLVEAALVAEVRQILSRPEESPRSPLLARCLSVLRPLAHLQVCLFGGTHRAAVGRNYEPWQVWRCAACGALSQLVRRRVHNRRSRARMQQCEPQRPKAVAGTVVQAATLSSV